jgi:hypothetical protein
MSDYKDSKGQLYKNPTTGDWEEVQGSGGAANIQSNGILPTDIQSRLQQTIQTHNAVSVAISGSSVESSYHDCDGYDKIAITFMNDAATTSAANIYWSNDGTTAHAYEYNIIPSNTTQKKGAITDTKARYFKVEVVNGDGAASHTMSAWAYLKA